MDEIWKVAKGVLGTVAPTLATAIGGPLAGQAVRAIGEALGLPADAGDRAVADAVAAATPEQLLALKKADQDFTIRMRELDIDVLSLDQRDRANAREMKVATKSWTTEVLAFVVVAGFLGTVYAVLAGFVEGMKDPLTATTVGTLIGYVSAKADQVISFYFGSSASSKAKDETIKGLSGR